MGMKKIYFLLCMSFLVSSSVVSCRTTNASYVSYETECLNVEQDGSVTVRAWGEGRNKADAVEQAKKNAVKDVIFKGIKDGKCNCGVKPLIFEVNAEEKYEEYFNIFFADGGEYKEYVSAEDEKFFSKSSQRNKVGAKYGVTVRVLKSELKQRLIHDGVIKLK